MRSGNLLGAAALLVLVSACSTTNGSGALRTETRSVSGFSTVELTGIGDVLIQQTGTESLSVQAEDNLLPDLTSEVSDGTLRLGTKSGVNLRPTKPITYRLTVKDLTGLRVSGSGNQHATSIATPTLTVDISGSGDITAGGSADTQAVTISGSGNYNAAALASKNAAIRLLGSGDATLNVTATLHTELSGSGNITYSGTPEITTDNTGSGELRRP